MTLVTEQNVAETLELLSKPKRLTTDTETTGFYVWSGDRLCGVSVLVPTIRGWPRFYFPFRHAGRNLSPTRLKQLVRILSQKTLTGWNVKFDIHMLMADGLRQPVTAEDIMLHFHLANENEWMMGGSYELKPSASRYIDPRAREAEIAMGKLLGSRGLGKGDICKLEAHEVEQYACDDVYYTEKFRQMLRPALVDWDLWKIAQELGPYMLVTRKMEARGMMLDLPLMYDYMKEAVKMQAKHEKIIRKLAGYNINLRSAPQLQAWLGLPSTAMEYLEEVAKDTESTKALIAYRRWQRVEANYYRVFEERRDANGILHPNIKLHGTDTGRPSAEKPPMQAIPRYTDIYKVKDIFRARPGHTLISADYSQMELRFGAHYAQDEFLIDAFRTGKNVHRMTENDIKQLGYEDFDYDKAKRVNFGVQYGVGARKLSKEIRRSEAVARQFLEAAHTLHPNYRPLYNQMERYARHNGYIRLWSGRVRRYNMPRPFFHKALSNFIQGGVAEVMRYAICRMDQELPPDVWQLLQVHDQVLFEAPTKMVPEVTPMIREQMTQGFDFCSVPFVVEIKAGPSWGKLKLVEETK